MRRNLLYLGIVIVLMGCHSPRGKGENVTQNILLTKSAQFSNNLEKKKISKVVGAYTDSAVVMPSGSNFITGKDSLIKYWEQSDQLTIQDHTIYPLEIETFGNLAYDYGYYRIKALRDSVQLPEYTGKYLIVWKKDKGEWKIHLDMFNSFKGNIPDSLKLKYEKTIN